MNDRVWDMKKNRDARRIDSGRKMELLTVACFLLLMIGMLISCLITTGKTVENDTQTPQKADDGRLPGDDIPATERCYMTAEEIEQAENEMIQAALIAKANRIDNCTVTWYTNDTCGKKPGDPAYGITASGLHTEEGLTCAVDNRVIPRYADVFVQFEDGTIEQYWATDTGVRGNHVDIFEPDYDTCIQNGRKSLTVWWIKEEAMDGGGN